MNELLKNIPLAHIVCQTSNNVIGLNNDLPWKCPKDMAYFKEKTLNRILILGFNTYKSIGGIDNIGKPNPVLKDRICIVIGDINRASPGSAWGLQSLQDMSDHIEMICADESKDFAGFTIFVPRLQDAVQQVQSISLLLKRYVDSGKISNAWSSELDDYMGMIIGGSKIYEQSLNSCNISTIYLNTMPIVQHGDNVATYPMATIREGFYSEQHLMEKWAITVGVTTFQRANVSIEVWKRKNP